MKTVWACCMPNNIPVLLTHVKVFLPPFYAWRHSCEEMYQALFCLTVLQATRSWVRAREWSYAIRSSDPRPFWLSEVKPGEKPCLVVSWNLKLLTSKSPKAMLGDFSINRIKANKYWTKLILLTSENCLRLSIMILTLQDSFSSPRVVKPHSICEAVGREVGLTYQVNSMPKLYNACDLLAACTWLNQ